MLNRLQNETSPYLKQHANNPVDWYAWGDEALSRARHENKPILLSVGYSACHWCHVMAHESFENPAIAAIMNEHYVNIKVDREERPDLDQIYQNVAQLITRSGGWPLTVFLTPDLKPFFGGTYFPPDDRYGRPGFGRVLETLAETFRADPASIEAGAQRLVDAIKTLETAKPETSHDTERPDRASLRSIADRLLEAIDWRDGGIGGAPKFPNTMSLSFLWRFAQATGAAKAREAVILSLTKMASGGIYDQLGGGFHRYSVDALWAVPHFEKMLYDNGLLLKLYAEVLLNDDPANPLPEPVRRLYEQVLRETVAYLLREMRSPEGGFYAAQDADSEGQEGKFFIWDLDELNRDLTPDEAKAFAAAYGVTKQGNFEDPHGHDQGPKTVLYRASAEPTDFESPLVRSAKQKLFTSRTRRITPGLDNKVLAAWNGLVISGLLWASKALAAAEPQPTSGATDSLDPATLSTQAYDAAVGAFAFVGRKLGRDGDRLWSVYAPGGGSPAPAATTDTGSSRFNAYLDDYAFLAQAALDLARFTTDAALARQATAQARRWIDVVLKHFKDPQGSGFYFTSDDHEALIQRPKTLYDQAIPAGISVTTNCLTVLGELYPEVNYAAEAESQVFRFFPQVREHPFGFGEMACLALMQAMGPVLVSGPQVPASAASRHPHVFVNPEAGGDDLLVCHARSCSLPLKDTGTAINNISFHLKL